jgi:metal-sulfur cluster biosynthetic enzyme
MSESTPPEPADQQPPEPNPDAPPAPQTDATPAEPPIYEPLVDSPLIEALKQVIDPELMINIVDLGLIYEVEQTDATVNVDMTLTSPACPAAPQIMQQAKMALERLDDVEEAVIKLVMSPVWSPDRMTDDARDQLGIF